MKEKIFKIIVIVLIVILIYKIVEISASYRTMLQSDIDTNVEQWVILVNGENIATTEEKTFDIKSYINQSNYVAEGKIAPGVTAKLPIKIDATQTQNLDIRYDIVLDLKGIENSTISTEDFEKVIKIKNIEEINGKTKILRTEENIYTGLILNENTKEHNIEINVIWENNEENNEIDTTIGTNLENISIPITIYISQYGNEPIEEYKKEK